jgi:hypothetical protein
VLANILAKDKSRGCWAGNGALHCTRSTGACNAAQALPRDAASKTETERELALTTVPRPDVWAEGQMAQVRRNPMQ